MSVRPIPMYQGEDFSQELSYFSDPVAVPPDEQTYDEPLVFTHPVMDVRDGYHNLLASFDDTGTQAGLMVITEPGVLVMSMPAASVAALPNGTYELDIFADVGGGREAITKRGVIELVVDRRNTVDDGP
jgi:hypothetical protein